MISTGFDSNDLIQGIAGNLDSQEGLAGFIEQAKTALQDPDRVARTTALHYLSNIIENYGGFITEEPNNIKVFLQSIIEVTVSNLYDDLEHDLYLINTLQRCIYSFPVEFRQVPVLGLMLFIQKYL